MDITEFKKSDFKDIPFRKWDEDIGLFRSLVIIPTNRKHDSGFKCMEFIAMDEDDKPIARLGGYSDVLHIDGIGGYGIRQDTLPKSIDPKGWSIDLLPCGYFRIFSDYHLTVGSDLSSLEIYSGKEIK